MSSHTPNLHVTFDEAPPPDAVDQFEQWAGPNGFCLERHAGGLSGFNRYTADVTQAALVAWLKCVRDARASEPRLTREARVGHTSFGVGVPERFVIEAAQRAAEHPQGDVDKAAAAELHRLIQENAERAAFLEAHPAVTAELAALIEENERLLDLVGRCALGDVVDWKAAAEQLVARAEADGVILMVERVPGTGGLAMRNHVARVSSYEKR